MRFFGCFVNFGSLGKLIFWKWNTCQSILAYFNGIFWLYLIEHCTLKVKPLRLNVSGTLRGSKGQLARGGCYSAGNISVQSS